MPVHDPAPNQEDAAQVLGLQPPSVDPNSRQAGAIMAGGSNSLWIVSPAEPVGLSSLDQAPAAGTAAPAADQAADQRWVLYCDPGEKEALYWVHDNGGRPFLVRVTTRCFAIYRVPQQIREPMSQASIKKMLKQEGGDFDVAPLLVGRDDEHWHEQGFVQPPVTSQEYHRPRLYSELVVGPAQYKRIWAGEDTTNEVPPHLTGFDLGNSLLVHLPAGTKPYLFVGSQIFAFELREGEEVVSYHSTIGNSDVPYPYLVTGSSTYLLTERVILRDDEWDRQQQPDPYRVYYSYGREEMRQVASFEKVVVVDRVW